MRITERQLELILSDKHYWRDVWLEVVAESARENPRQIKISESGSGGLTSRTSHGTDTVTGRASSFPVSEFQEKVRNTATHSLDRMKDHPGGSCKAIHLGTDHDDWMAAEEEKEEILSLSGARRFDSRFEVVTAEPRPRGTLPVPKLLDTNQVQKFSLPDRLVGPAPRDPNANKLLAEWNRGKQPFRERHARKVFLEKKR